MDSLTYYDSIRSDIKPLLPGKVDRVLEIGCGTGNTLAWIKQTQASKWVAGVELNENAAEKAKSTLDAVYCGNIENMSLPIPDGSLDLILCLDVLEHLVDPWKLMKRLHVLLKPGGSVIASIPNVRNFRVVLPLVFRGRWDYAPDGLLDKTHLRYFTRKTALALMESAGMSVDLAMVTGMEKGSKSRIANIITFSLFKDYFVVQYLIRANING